MHPPYTNKNTLRNTLRQQRAQLPKSLQKTNSEIIVQRIYESLVFKKATQIAFYSPVQGEVDPLPLTQLSKKANDNKHFYLPILQADDEPLLFAPVTEKSDFLLNRFSIPEPAHKQSEQLTPDSLELVLMPLLGFDKQGNRLGMGGGFYDRTFAFKKHSRCKPILMGIAYSLQEIDTLKAESWDIPLDFMVTEKQFIAFKEPL